MFKSHHAITILKFLTNIQLTFCGACFCYFFLALVASWEPHNSLHPGSIKGPPTLCNASLRPIILPLAPALVPLLIFQRNISSQRIALSYPSPQNHHHSPTHTHRPSRPPFVQTIKLGQPISEYQGNLGMMSCCTAGFQD